MSIKIEKALEKVVKGWTPKPEDNTFRETEELRRLLKTLISNHRVQIRTLNNLLSALPEDGDIDDEMMTALSDHLVQTETVFLREKKLVSFIEQGKITPDASAKLKAYGKWYSGNYSLTRSEEGAYEFSLPPLSSQYNLEKVHNEGRDLQQLVLYLIDEYMGEGNEFELFNNATIEFYHHIDSKLPDIFVPDADNIYVKKVIDCLHGFIIDSDNLLHLDLAHYGVKSTKSYTKMVVKKGQKVPHKTGN